jgi:cysteine desulfurase
MPVYFDHNASAPMDRAVREGLARHLAAPPGNPSSVHGHGRAARAELERARRVVAARLGVKTTELVFTSGATEALHLAIRGLVPQGGHVVSTTLEHAAVDGALAVAGAEVDRVEPDPRGRLSPKAFVDRLRVDTRLVVCIGAQNEIGSLTPVAEVACLVGSVPVLCDATQMWGRVPLNPYALGVSLVTLSGHKIGAPAGIGLLWVRPGTCLAPTQKGGVQERERRAGTENLLGAVGLGLAAEQIEVRLAEMPRIRALRDRLRAGLEALEPSLVVHGEPTSGLPNTLSFRVPDLEGDAVLAAFDLAGFSLSSGSACASGALEPSPVLLALGLSARDARRGLRISLGPENTADEVQRFLAAWPGVAARIRDAEVAA